jgi:hypothetical protein
MACVVPGNWASKMARCLGFSARSFRGVFSYTRCERIRTPKPPARGSPGDVAIDVSEARSFAHSARTALPRPAAVRLTSSKQYVEMFTIDPVDLQAALDKDVAYLPEPRSSAFLSFVR